MGTVRRSALVGLFCRFLYQRVENCVKIAETYKKGEHING